MKRTPSTMCPSSSAFSWADPVICVLRVAAPSVMPQEHAAKNQRRPPVLASPVIASRLPANSRRRNFWIFPMAIFGSSVNTTWRGQ